MIAFFVTNMIYNKNLEKVYTDIGKTDNEDSIIDNSGIEAASSGIGMTVEEKINESQEVSSENEDATEVSIKEKDLQETNNNEEPKVEEKKEEEKPEEPVEQKEPEFIKPVEGNMMKEYAKDKLVYSETLKEWTVHNGVDILSEKTTVVKASESGKVIAIKNDPRYGITVIIEHSNGYETRYANLLTAEFVNVGETVEKGQTVGTVGNTATFEVMDESHLHFEILKDGEYLDPALFIEV